MSCINHLETPATHTCEMASQTAPYVETVLLCSPCAERIAKIGPWHPRPLASIAAAVEVHLTEIVDDDPPEAFPRHRLNEFVAAHPAPTSTTVVVGDPDDLKLLERCYTFMRDVHRAVGLDVDFPDAMHRELWDALGDRLYPTGQPLPYEVAEAHGVDMTGRRITVASGAVHVNGEPSPRAENDASGEVIADGAFDGQLGKTMPVLDADRNVIGHAVVTGLEPAVIIDIAINPTKEHRA